MVARGCVAERARIIHSSTDLRLSKGTPDGHCNARGALVGDAPNRRSPAPTRSPIAVHHLPDKRVDNAGRARRGHEWSPQGDATIVEGHSINVRHVTPVGDPLWWTTAPTVSKGNSRIPRHHATSRLASPVANQRSANWRRPGAALSSWRSNQTRHSLVIPATHADSYGLFLRGSSRFLEATRGGIST